MGAKYDLIEKADMTLQDLKDNGGYLLPKPAAAFIKRAIDEAAILPLANVKTLSTPSEPVETVGFDGRILHMSGERQALPLNLRSKPTTTKVMIDTQEAKAEVRLPDRVVEDNIERGTFKDTVIALMTKQVGVDMEEILLRSDLNSADPDLNKFDGILKQIAVNVVAAQGNTLSSTLLAKAYRLMPPRYARNPKALRYFTSPRACFDYKQTLAGRLTTLGDQFMVNDQPAPFNGSLVFPVPIFPIDLPQNGNKSAVLFTDPQNITVGIWRQVKIELGRDISAGETIIVCTVQFAGKLALVDAAVKIENLGLAV